MVMSPRVTCLRRLWTIETHRSAVVMVMSRRVTCLRRLWTIETHRARIYRFAPCHWRRWDTAFVVLVHSIVCCVDDFVYRTTPDSAINYNAILSVTSLLRNYRYCQCWSAVNNNMCMTHALVVSKNVRTNIYWTLAWLYDIVTYKRRLLCLSK